MNSQRKINLKNPIWIILTLIIIIAALAVYHFYVGKKIIDETHLYMKEIYRIERAFIENIPVFEDFTSPEKEQNLRKYLLNSHIRAAVKYGVKPVRDNNEAGILAEKGELVHIIPAPENLFYFYNVRDELRYLTPLAAAGLDMIAGRFQENIRKKAQLPAVKLAVSSALRPLDYQKDLSRKNLNAAIESTHCYGASFDIFYDDYYIVLPEPSAENSTAKKLQEDLRRRFGFLLGDAIRREFHSVLMETLTQLQDEGVIYAILEKKQRCYHVTILKIL